MKPTGNNRRRSLFLSLIRRQPLGEPGTSEASSRKSSDWVVAALGLALGVTCGLFPWYIFFNQEQFGVRALRFAGSDDATASGGIASQPQRIGAPISAEEVPISRLDLFATAGVSKDEPTPAVSLQDQPFPSDVATFKLVHIANGRAMIEDSDGIWLVQVGSVLPDSSRVKALEKQDGQWALVTSDDQVIRIAR